MNELTTEWQPMESFPKDGTRCDILLGNDIIAFGIFWGQHPAIKGRWGFRGSQNMLSQYCINLGSKGWRKHVELKTVPIKPGENPEIKKVTFL